MGHAPVMSSRQRVRCAFARQQPDRVPIDYIANPGIDGRLKKHFGLSSDDHEGLRRALGVDFRRVDAPYTGPKLHPDFPQRGVRSDLFGVRTIKIEHESGYYWDYCDFPLMDADEQQVADWPMPSPDDFDYDHVRQVARAMPDYALALGHPGVGDVINSNGFLRGVEQALIDLVTDDPAGLLLAKRRSDIWLGIIERALDAADGRVDFLWLGEDLGTQIAPIISLDIYRKHIRPLHQPFIDLAKSDNIPVMVHSCGSSSWAYDDFIEMGVSVVDTLQPEATNMQPAYLKQRFGDRLAFHGCISTAGPIAYGSVDDTINNCREILDTMMPGGGYCFCPTHELQDNSPTQNVLAAYQTARDHGQYQ